MTKNERSILAALAVLGGLLPGRVAAQSYGTGDQVLTIDAAYFRGLRGPGFTDTGDGYLYGRDNKLSFVAPVLLPDGAEITQICLYARNESPDHTSYVALQLEAVKLVPGGQQSAVALVPGAGLTAGHFGYGVVCTDPISYVFHDTRDVDGDGISDAAAHRLVASVSAAGSSLGIGGARIVWHRQVSPKPATAAFSDVPTTHQFFQFVEALRAAGITNGYPDGRFGVNDPITRGQMAVYLAAALGLHWPN